MRGSTKAIRKGRKIGRRIGLANTGSTALGAGIVGHNLLNEDLFN